MDESRSSTPEPPQDLWSSILDSVSSTRSIPSKHVLLLGQSSSGKSTLANALLGKPAPADSKDDQKIDYALGYDFADVRDDADEDTLARLSVYTVPSAAPAYTTLVPHFLPPRANLPHTLVIVTLDWTRPWTFVEELETWLQWVEKWTRGDGSREVEIAVEESRERLQHYLQHYAEPASESTPMTSTMSSTVLPLGPGTFTHNTSGIPIIVACTKADLIDEDADLVAGASGMGGMVKGKGGEWEERTDGIMQALRTICLKYGAALFYTTPLPATLQILRQYALHLLFAPPPPSPLTSTAEAAAPARNPFPFHHKPNTLDRDHIIIPAGWDSWGKIVVMRDGFDAKIWGEAWERDLEPLDGVEQPGAKKLFRSLVPDQGIKPHPLPPFNNPTPEQAFLARNYDENAKKPDRDPPRVVKSPVEMAEAATAGVVGPLASSIFSLPTVERTFSEMEAGIGGSVAGSADSRRRATGRPPSSTLSTSLGASTAAAGAGRTAALGSAGPNSASGQTQHEVLQNFFQSLLSSKDRQGGGSARPPPKTNGTGTAGSGGGTEESG